MGQDDPAEVPLDDLLERPACGQLVRPAHLILGCWLRVIPHTKHYLPPQSQQPVNIGRFICDVLDQIDQQKCSTRPVIEGDLPDELIASDQDLIEDARPGFWRLISQDPIKIQL